jgi:hypothetical protein
MDHGPIICEKNNIDVYIPWMKRSSKNYINAGGHSHGELVLQCEVNWV